MEHPELPREPGRARRLAYGDMIRRRRGNLMIRGSRIPVYSGGINTEDISYEVLSELPRVTIGTSLKELVETTRVQVTQKEQFCCICQHDCLKGEIIRELLCQHSFHINCIDTWLCDNKCCPLCKSTLH
ncbi:MAG: hypothetical protein EBU90_09170 [Proteobacteria bacterium]|nr:hypothetical protein [Pseudomonadota bacterium]NBP14276.1 hypothetical protein [bacterium]